MKTILVDDELLSMAQFEIECESVENIEVVGKFTSGEDALDYARSHPVDFALLDIEMPQMNGLELAQGLREIHPEVIIIFVTGYSQYAAQAFQIKADYMVMKPYTKEDMLDAIERAALLSGRQKKRVFIRTFGYFDVFVEGKPVPFSTAKAKELLALLVDRNGGTVRAAEAIAYLWEDKPYDESVKNLYRKVCQRLKETLQRAGISDLVIHDGAVRYINKGICDCDYFLYLQESPSAKFRGEYMTQYSWAEATLASLLEK